MASLELLKLLADEAHAGDPDAARALVNLVISGVEMNDPVVAKELSDALLQSVLIDILMQSLQSDQIALVMGQRVRALLNREAKQGQSAMVGRDTRRVRAA